MLVLRKGEGEPDVTAPMLFSFQRQYANSRRGRCPALTISRPTILRCGPPDACTFEKCFSSEKITFVQFEPALEAGFEDVDVFGDFVAVEAHAGFEAEGVARAEAAGADAELGAGVEECVPHLYCCGFVGGDVDLEAVFAAVAGARDEDVVDAGDLSPGEPVIFDRGEVDLGELLQGFKRARALQS